MFQNIINQSGNRFALEHLRSNKQKTSEGKETIEEKQFYWKVCNVLGKTLYCIRKYFIM